ncbi:MAG: pyruvate dehydrogenase (acetyl-transferring) E1 component subunit alpha [Nevskiaceae bacterium]|nr:MAG: pyruvate dehydrogenase (acetyl-transferring) E1 component subunit alpha [Nevskiaceae bacterium]TBR73661.1 MAG: pyruvate dehydrogenase (acetyl-transferring) E1 component subunit alpha [Nevskiaceae bacterium]
MQTPDEARTRVASFEIFLTRFLDDDGRPLCRLPAAARRPQRLLHAYRLMARIRAFENKAVALQRTGQLGTYASGLGQEAVNAAIGLGLARDDVYLGNYRECGVPLARGVPMAQILQYWGGDERGMAWPRTVPAFHDFPFAVPVASQVPQALGVAYAMQLRHEKRATLVTCGDGASSKGDFAEAVSAAGVWKLPVVFVIINNQWAISLPRSRQCAAVTLAQKGLAGGIVGEQVDGNDLIATCHVIETALARARSGAGPQLVEALTYRLADHTTADDARRYRDAAEVDTARKHDPLARLHAWLEAQCGFTAQDETRLQAEVAAEVGVAVKTFLATPAPPPEALFDALYAELPPALHAQAFAAAGGGEA